MSTTVSLFALIGIAYVIYVTVVILLQLIAKIRNR